MNIVERPKNWTNKYSCERSTCMFPARALAQIWALPGWLVWYPYILMLPVEKCSQNVICCNVYILGLVRDVMNYGCRTVGSGWLGNSQLTDGWPTDSWLKVALVFFHTISHFTIFYYEIGRSNTCFVVILWYNSRLCIDIGMLPSQGMYPEEDDQLLVPGPVLKYYWCGSLL